MCNLYSAKCNFCDNMIEMHIADYCTSPENVLVVCHECAEQGLVVPPVFNDKQWAHLPQTIERESQVWRYLPEGDTVDIGVIGAEVCVYCSDDAAHGISLN